jgi:hypothetical protein
MSTAALTPVCPGCRYDLSGAATDKCPECGGKFWITVNSEVAGARRRLPSLVRVGASLAAIGVIAWVALMISNGSIFFWWSIFAASTVWGGAVLLVIAALGAAAPARAVVQLLCGLDDASANAQAAEVFSFVWRVALWMGGLGIALGAVGYLSMTFKGASVQALGHGLAIVAVCPVYALLLAIPSYVACVALNHRARAKHPASVKPTPSP